MVTAAAGCGKPLVSSGLAIFCISTQTGLAGAPFLALVAAFGQEKCSLVGGP